MKKYVHAFILLIATTVSSNSQSFTVNGPRTVSDLAADKGINKYTFFNLDQGREVSVTDSNSTKWDIAFNATTIIVNSGISGPGTVSAQVVSETSFANLKDAPETGYAVDSKDVNNKTLLAIMSGTGKGWYVYNSVNHGGPHSITPIADRIIVVKLADGRYAKIQILNYYKGAPQNIPVIGSATYDGIGAYYQFKYLISDAASTHVSSIVTGVKSLYAAGKRYQFFNFASADTVAVADSATVKWDVAFKGTTILVNGGGASGVSTVNAQVISETSFDGLTTAPATGYAADASSLKAIKTGSGNGWYSYNSINNAPPHSITPIADRIIVIKLADGRYVKLQILNYYKGAPANVPVSGTVEYDGIGSYYTFRYRISEAGSADITTDVDDEIVPTGVFTSSSKSVSIYPNPLTSSATTLTIAFEVNTGNVRIVDLLGNQVYASTMNGKSSTFTNINLAEGMYIVVLESEGNVYQQKLVIE